MGLEKNTDKTKAIVCTPGYIRGKCSEASYKRRDTTEGETFRERKRAMLSCKIYGVIVAASSLRGHMVRRHGKRPS